MALDFVTRSQRYSQIVFMKIQGYVDSPNAAKYKSLCKKSGGLLRTMGLIQFLVFLKAKSEKMPQYGDLLKHLQQELKDLKAFVSANENNLIQELLKEKLPSYMKLTKTVLTLLQWHKRIAEILIKAEEVEGAE